VTELWEVLVPTVRRVGGRPYRTRFHRVWDAKVRALTGGLTILTPVKGQWVAPDGELFKERMIPVRIACTPEQVKAVVKMPRAYYDQLAVMAYKISDTVLMEYAP